MLNGENELRQRIREGNRREEKPAPAARKNEDLLHWKDMPRHLQFNPYIFTGYRPLLSIWGCLNSLLYLHNETINIFTHGKVNYVPLLQSLTCPSFCHPINPRVCDFSNSLNTYLFSDVSINFLNCPYFISIPIVYILLSIPNMKPWTRSDLRFLTWCHVIGSISPWVGSFVYHLFMNLERGENIYYRLLQLDMLGIWICQSFDIDDITGDYNVLQSTDITNDLLENETIEENETTEENKTTDQDENKLILDTVVVENHTVFLLTDAQENFENTTEVHPAIKFRKVVSEIMEHAAKKMIERTNEKLKKVNVENSVNIAVPAFNHGPANLIGIQKGE
ncbi:hypothetical protein FQA39_LY17025 [Lamprigera yunnana]|nr:hypothetical protein FQA39_LY17025 [Lamprigera yunnana]